MKVEEILEQLRGDAEKRRRFLKVDRTMVDEKKRTVDLAFSSETPVPKWYGIEILDHSPGCMRLDRAAGGIPLLYNHDRDALIGRMSDVRCDADKVGRASARFGNSTTADQMMRDVQDGILTDVSVGYQVHHMEEMDPKDMPPDLMEMAAREKSSVYRITDWEPFECSLVTVPADPTVGVGRSMDPSKEQEMTPASDDSKSTTIEVAPIRAKEEMKMDKTLEEIEKDAKERADNAAKEARDKAEERVAGIYDLAQRFATFVPKFITDKAFRDRMPLDEFQKLVLARVEGGKPIDTPIDTLGLTAKEKNRYSLSRVILAELGERVDASFERSISAELSKRLDVAPRGILVPFEVLGKRDLNLASDAAGGYLKGTDHLGGEFIDVLRNRMLAVQLGARTLTGLRGNVVIPKRTAGATSAWVADGSAAAEGANTFGQLSLSPKNVSAWVNVGRTLLIQGDPSVDGLVVDDLSKSIAGAVDKAVFHGAGTDEPTGIANTSSIGAFTGTSLDWAAILNAETDVAAANADAATCAYVTTPAVRALLKARVKASSTWSPVWEDAGVYYAGAQGALPNPAFGSGRVNGYRAEATNQITAGYMFFGDFSQVVIGSWGSGVDIVVDKYTNATTGIVRIVAFHSVDVGVRYAGAFSMASSIT